MFCFFWYGKTPRSNKHAVFSRQHGPFVQQSTNYNSTVRSALSLIAPASFDHLHSTALHHAALHHARETTDTSRAVKGLERVLPGRKLGADAGFQRILLCRRDWGQHEDRPGVLLGMCQSFGTATRLTGADAPQTKPLLVSVTKSGCTLCNPTVNILLAVPLVFFVLPLWCF